MTYENNDVTQKVGEALLINQNKKMNKFIGWLLWSSVNSEKISLTLKAGIPFLVLWGVSDTATLNHFVGTIGEVLVALGTAVSGLITVFGLVRKIWFTME